MVCAPKNEKTIQPRSPSLPAGAGVLRERGEPAFILTRTSKCLTSVCLRLVAAGKGFLPPHRGTLSSTSVLTAICRVPSKQIEQNLFLIPEAKWSQLALSYNGPRCFGRLVLIVSSVWPTKVSWPVPMACSDTRSVRELVMPHQQGLHCAMYDCNNSRSSSPWDLSVPFPLYMKHSTSNTMLPHPQPCRPFLPSWKPSLREISMPPVQALPSLITCLRRGGQQTWWAAYLNH